MNSHGSNINSLESLEKVFTKRITIYGAYFPGNELQRLKNLRNFLRKEGFKKVKLVRDYPRCFFKFPYIREEDEFIYEKSIYCVEKSDMNVFIYTYKGKLEGETIELKYAIDEGKNFLVFVETGKRLPACSRIITGLLRKIGIKYNPFPKNNDRHLQDAVFQRINEFFI